MEEVSEMREEDAQRGSFVNVYVAMVIEEVVCLVAELSVDDKRTGRRFAVRVEAEAAAE